MGKIVEVALFDSNHFQNSILGHTDLRTGVSEAKFDAEADFEVRLPPAPPKPRENHEKQIFGTTFQIFWNFPETVQTHPKASERIRTHPNASEWIRTGPNGSEQVRKRQKTCENQENFAKISQKFSQNLVVNRTASSGIGSVI